MCIGLWPAWPHTQFLFLGLGPRHQIRCCLHLAPSSVVGVAQVVHSGSPTGPDPPPYIMAEPDHPKATGPPSSKSLAPSNYLSVPPRGSHWVKNTQDQNILFPQGGEHKVVGSHQGSATWGQLGRRRQLTQPLTLQCPHSFIWSLIHLLTP